MMNTSSPSLAFAVAATLAILMASAAAAQTGVVPALRPGKVHLQTTVSEGEWITLPDGIRGLKNRGEGYRVRYTEKTRTQQDVSAWLVTFCDKLDKKPNVTFGSRTGPRNRVTDFSCN